MMMKHLNKMLFFLFFVFSLSDTYAQIEANFDADVYEGCVPLTITFTNTSKAYTSFEWDFGDQKSTDTETEFIFSTPGIFEVSLTCSGSEGNTKSKTKTITVHPKPKATFGVNPTTVVFTNQPSHLYNQSQGATKYFWQYYINENEVFENQEMNPMIYFNKPGKWNIRLLVENEYGCQDSVTMQNAVLALEGTAIKFPTAFSPSLSGPKGGHYLNGIYTNDVFYPKFIGGISEYHLEIFSSSGQLIFESKDPEIGWDGYYKNNLCDMTNYFYIAKGKFDDGTNFSKKGLVLLVR